ncbi:MAG: starvation-sensing protein RspA [Bryobacterales bacterium]|nr:starvation-sensing protein RspA [Bryobacterales bacterium]
MPKLTIKQVYPIVTSPGGRYQWVFVKVVTSEPGLYGIGSASNVHQALTVAAAIEKHLAPFWIGRDVDRIDDIWYATTYRSYRRSDTVLNNALSGLDMALWDIKGKRAGMPVYDLLGGKVRDAVPCYGHADGKSMDEVADNVKAFLDRGYRHVRAQIGGYGGGGMIAPGQGTRPKGGYAGSAFEEEVYVEAIPKLMEHLRVRLGKDVKLIHDVHEHLSPTMAVELARRMEPYRMFYVEDILPPEMIQWFRNIRQVTTTPLAMGEIFTNPQEWLPCITERIIDYVRCRISTVGGITPARKIANLCETFGVRTAWQEGGDNDPVNFAAACHIDLASTAFGIQEDNRWPDMIHELLPGTPKLPDGFAYVNEAPGLGIDIKEEEARKFPLTPPSGKEDGFTVRAIDGSLVRP